MDSELNYLNKLREGDHKAFDKIYLHYSPKVRHFLTGFIKNAEEANDMTQEIFYKIWVNRETVSKVESFSAYLFRIARNMLYDYFEHQQIVENYQLKQQKQSPIFEDLIEEELYAKELSLLIDLTIEKMPPQRRLIFIMSRKEGLNNDEIALKLNINKRTVENHLTQALADLRRVIFNTSK